jgi:hypothetical protein
VTFSWQSLLIIIYWLHVTLVGHVSHLPLLCVCLGCCVEGKGEVVVVWAYAGWLALHGQMIYIAACDCWIFPVNRWCEIYIGVVPFLSKRVVSSGPFHSCVQMEDSSSTSQTLYSSLRGILLHSDCNKLNHYYLIKISLSLIIWLL